MNPKILAYSSITMAIIVIILTLGVIIFPKFFKRFDTSLVLKNQNSPRKDRIAFWIDRSINWRSILFFYFFLGLGLFLLKELTAFGVVFFSILGGSLGFWTLKRITQRNRPAEARVFYKDYSFPSGHTTTGVIVLLTVAYLLSLWSSLEFLSRIFYLLALLGGAVIGRSRRYLKVHWVSDVITAWLLGIGCFIFSYLLFLYFGDAILISMGQVFFSL